MKILLIIACLLIIGCSSNDLQLAENYKLEMQYYDNALKFARLNMIQPAIESCSQTQILRNECYTSLAQDFIIKNITIEFCEEIVPDQKMNMTMRAFRLVYESVDDDLKEELKEKLNPSEKRIEEVREIRSRCR